MTEKQITWLPRIVGGLFVFAILLWGYQRIYLPSNNVSVTAALCDYAIGPCRVELSGEESIEFSITPGDIPLLKPLIFQVRLSGLKPDGPVLVRIEGIDMEMGSVHQRLKPQDAGHYQEEVVLSVCSTELMNWKADVVFQHQGRHIKASFPFQTRFRPRFRVLQ